MHYKIYKLVLHEVTVKNQHAKRTSQIMKNGPDVIV